MNDYMNKLVRIGLTSLEAKVYFALLKKKNFTATEISKLTHISRQKAYEVLSKLEQKGLCTETLGKIKKYSVINPKIGLESVLKEFEEKKKVIKELSDFLLPLYNAEKENTDPLDYIQVLRDKNTIIKTFEKLEKNATKEVLSFVKGPFFSDVMDRLYKPEDIRESSFLKRGVDFKTIYHRKDFKNPIFFKNVEMYENAGEQIRIVDTLPIPFKMYVFDEKIAMFTLEDRLPEKISLTTMIVEHPDLSKGLKIIFNLYWQSSMTLEEFKMKEMKK